MWRSVCSAQSEFLKTSTRAAIGPSCKQVQAGSHPDLLVVERPEGKQELPIDLLIGAPDKRGREGLCHDLALRPMSASRRVAIIDDAHTMNDASANALLKTLEEPPSGSILFLTAPESASILSTIRSRCQPILFSPLSPENLTELLIEQGLETDRAQAARNRFLSEGSLEVAQQLHSPELRSIRAAVYRQLAASNFQSLAASKLFRPRLTRSAKTPPPSAKRPCGWCVLPPTFIAACWGPLWWLPRRKRSVSMPPCSDFRPKI